MSAAARPLRPARPRRDGPRPVRGPRRHRHHLRGRLRDRPLRRRPRRRRAAPRRPGPARSSSRSTSTPARTWRRRPGPPAPSRPGAPSRRCPPPRRCAASRPSSATRPASSRASGPGRSPTRWTCRAPGISLAGARELAARLRAGVPGAADVDYGNAWLETLERLVRRAKLAALVLFVALAVATAVLVSNTLRLAVFSRRDELES